MVKDLHEAYYAKYLKDIRGVGDTTVYKYQGALKTISDYLVKKGILKESIYEISDSAELDHIKSDLYSDSQFHELDERGHRMYSAGLNNYCRFVNGDDFAGHPELISEMDMEMPKKGMLIKESSGWERSDIIKKQSLESAGYQCEISPEHVTFTAKSTGHQYMEGHHAIPMKQQDKFNNSLDVYANVVCLCPICHRLLHYGIALEKKGALDKIYYDRADRLAKSGIKVSREEFEELAI